MVQIARVMMFVFFVKALVALSIVASVLYSVYVAFVHGLMQGSLTLLAVLIIGSFALVLVGVGERKIHELAYRQIKQMEQDIESKNSAAVSGSSVYLKDIHAPAEVHTKSISKTTVDQNQSLQTLDGYSFSRDDGYYSSTGEHEGACYYDFVLDFSTFNRGCSVEDLRFQYEIQARADVDDAFTESFDIVVTISEPGVWDQKKGTLLLVDVSTHESTLLFVNLERAAELGGPSCRYVLGLFFGHSPTDKQRQDFLSFLGRFDTLLARVQIANRVIYEQFWALDTTLLLSLINGSRNQLLSHVDSTNIEGSEATVEDVDLEVSRIAHLGDNEKIQVVAESLPMWVSGELMNFASQNLPDDSVDQWLTSNYSKHHLLTRQDILDFYNAMRKAKPTA